MELSKLFLLTIIVQTFEVFQVPWKNKRNPATLELQKERLQCTKRNVQNWSNSIGYLRM